MLVTINFEMQSGNTGLVKGRVSINVWVGAWCSRNLRSSSHHLLSVGYMRTVSSSRCFRHSAAINWNDLPFDIRACDSVNVFKRKLKTHLFNIAYAT